MARRKKVSELRRDYNQRYDDALAASARQLVRNIEAALDLIESNHLLLSSYTLARNNNSRSNPKLLMQKLEASRILRDAVKKAREPLPIFLNRE